MADFFEKMSDALNKGVATVSTGSKNMIEKSKINSCIKNLDAEKKQLLELLGNKVYSHIKENAEGDIPRELAVNFCGEIDNRLAQIEEQKMLLAKLDEEMNQIRGGNSSLPKLCSCGYENAPDSNFCRQCGNKL